jgi:hypothetical protein
LQDLCPGIELKAAIHKSGRYAAREERIYSRGLSPEKGEEIVCSSDPGGCEDKQNRQA